MTTVVVAGALANKPGNGGEAWVRMSWARGLARLGLDVWFVETLSGAAVEDPGRARALRFFEDVTAANGFADRRPLGWPQTQVLSGGFVVWRVGGEPIHPSWHSKG